MGDIEVKCFPARNGESFLVTIQHQDKDYNILIDTGFTDTYKCYINPELNDLSELDLMVLTHIDDDHINGATALFNDNVLLNKMEIKRIWYNDLYKILQYIRKEKISLYEGKYRKQGEGIFNDATGFYRAQSLFRYILDSQYFEVWNNEGLIQCKDEDYKEIYPFNNDIKFVLLSPMERRINELLNKWLSHLKVDINSIDFSEQNIDKFNNYFKYDERVLSIFNRTCSNKLIDIESLADKNFNNNNTPNNASIAFFIEFSNKRILFLGDSNSEDIKLSLRKYKEDNNLSKITFDLVKVSHHGSKNNIHTDFFDIFSSNRYLIATNGDRHNHPDIECVSKIIVKQKEFKKIIFNYPRNNILNLLQQEKLKTKYNYDLEMPKERNEIINVVI